MGGCCGELAAVKVAMKSLYASFIGTSKSRLILRRRARQAGVEEQSFPVSCVEHVEIEADVGIDKPLLVERRFPARLETDEKDEFHAEFRRVDRKSVV